MSYQVLARRWRPLTFDAVVGQAPIVRTLRNALAQERIAHAYLFAGPRGVGKTTTARLLAMGLNCERSRAAGAVPCAACEPCREVATGRALDVIEIDGASNRGIDEVRTLRDNARYAPARGRRKVYIIDEVHMLTEPAFNALLKTLEEPPAHVVFVLATTEARRLPPTILSRCQRFDFRPIAGAEIEAALRRILEDEKVPGGAVEPDALRLLARAADGSLRDALSLLDTALAYGEGRVGARTVEELLGSGGAEAAWALAEVLVRRAAPDALQRIADAAAGGLDLALLCQETMEVLRRALLLVVTGSPGPDATMDETARLRALSSEGGPGRRICFSCCAASSTPTPRCAALRIRRSISRSRPCACAIGHGPRRSRPCSSAWSGRRPGSEATVPPSSRPARSRPTCSARRSSRRPRGQWPSRALSSAFRRRRLLRARRRPATLRPRRATSRGRRARRPGDAADPDRGVVGDRG